MRAGLVCAFALTLLPGPSARAKSSVYAQYVRASRALAEWRFADAERELTQMRATSPTAPETAYVAAELALYAGNYGQGLQALHGHPDSALSGTLGPLRSLLQSTQAVINGHKVITSKGKRFAVHYSDADAAIAELAADVLEAAYQVMATDFAIQPAGPIRLEIVGSAHDLARLSTLTEAEIDNTGTIALCKYNKLMVVSPRGTVMGYPWMDTLVHEYVHYAISYASLDHVPVWLQEGIARFQQTRWRAPAGVALSAVDQHLLADALANRKLIAFADMHPSIAKLPSQPAAATAFAQVYTLLGFLHSKFGYAGLRRVVEKQRDGSDAFRVVADVYGAPWQAIEAAWKKHLNELGLKTSWALVGRAGSKRIRLQKANAGSQDDVGYDEVGDARAKKFVRLGGILRARRMFGAAALEYEKALAITGRNHPFIAGRLSRVYLELGRYKEAIEFAEPLVSLDEYDPVPPTTAGMALLRQREFARARPHLEMALRITPFDPAIRCGLAATYQQLNETALAGREQTACRMLSPRSHGTP